MQIDNPERGFSFRSDGPLDMRMSASGQSAYDIINSYGEKELADLIYHYGEDRKSRQIASAIVKARTQAPIQRTKELADIIRRVVKGGKDKIDPSTRTFQALRIKVNDELGELTQALESAERLLADGGRLVVVTFHSLEDRIVKQFFQSRSGETRGGSRHLPPVGATHRATAGRLPTFFLPARKPVLPSSREILSNARARSAKLRLAIRTEVPI
jgi:16S rRNA (cytosine1402-N4)-methyltransferase